MSRGIDQNGIGSSDVALQINGLSMDYSVNVAMIIGYSHERKKRTKYSPWPYFILPGRLQI